VFNNFFFFENRTLYEIIYKNMVEPDRPQAHALCMPDKEGYRHALRICNNYCFSMATAARERASILRYTYIVCLIYLPVRVLETWESIGLKMWAE
jgi:hypothetical protein